MMFFNRIFKTIILIEVLQLILSVNSKEIHCNSLVNVNWEFSGKVENFVTCFIDHLIEEQNETFSRRKNNPKVFGLKFANNQNLFLPVKVSMIFPNLITYNASSTSIKQIVKENFVRLGSLKFLDLSRNQIEKIYGDTFEDLESLEEVHLSKFLFCQFFLQFSKSFELFNL